MGLSLSTKPALFRNDVQMTCGWWSYGYEGKKTPAKYLYIYIYSSLIDFRQHFVFLLVFISQLEGKLPNKNTFPHGMTVLWESRAVPRFPWAGGDTSGRQYTSCRDGSVCCRAVIPLFIMGLQGSDLQGSKRAPGVQQEGTDTRLRPKHLKTKQNNRGKSIDCLAKHPVGGSHLQGGSERVSRGNAGLMKCATSE